MKPGKQTFLKPCLTALLLLVALLGGWSIRGFSLDAGWPLSDYSGYRCEVYTRDEENYPQEDFGWDFWPGATISVDYSQQKFYVYDEQTREQVPYPLLQKYPRFQIFVHDGTKMVRVKKQENPTVSFLLTSSDFLHNKYTIPQELDVDKFYIGYKPVIYLYPEAETEVSVRLDYKGRLTCTYPAPDPDGAWHVTARPDGTLTDKQGREYSYLFWEGASDGTPPDFSRGFVVRGSDTAAFLREKLAYMGLTPREYNEFIVYWLPRMQDNPWNLIAFQGKNYTDSAPLTVTPRPESVLRVFMAYRPLNAPISVPPQELTPFVRRGFTLVEWGGQGPDGTVR